MEQRRLRLGDILDDYCPRERRVTNHVIVAMVEDGVKHTRCSTCDADHEYKQARVPTLRKKREVGVLSSDVSAEIPRPRRPEAADVVDVAVDEVEAVAGLQEPNDDVVVSVPEAEMSLAAEDEEPVVEPREDDGPVHRRLIRATLPRPEGQVPERRATEFTVKQQSYGRFDQRGDREPNGNRPPGARRHDGPRQDQPRRDGQRHDGQPRGNGQGPSRFGQQGRPAQGGGQGQRQGGQQPGQPGQPGQRKNRGGRRRGR